MKNNEDIRCPLCGWVCMPGANSSGYKWCPNTKCEVATASKDGTYTLKDMEPWERLSDEEKQEEQQDFKEWLVG